MSIFRILSITMAQNIEEFKSNVSNAFISRILCNIVYVFDTYARMKLDNLEFFFSDTTRNDSTSIRHHI